MVLVRYLGKYYYYIVTIDDGIMEYNYEMMMTAAWPNFSNLMHLN